MFTNNNIRAIAVCLMVAFCVVFGANQALSQSSVSGAVAGTVADPNNAVVSGATVTLTSLGTNKIQVVTTGNEGLFRFPNLQPGEYKLSISANGFNEYKQEQITIEVGKLVTIDANLQIVGAAATVDVTSDASLVNIETKDFATNINQTSINELPINGRRWSNFAMLTPGSVPDGNFGLVSFRGISGLLNNSTVDGGDNNQYFFSEERGRTRISYSISQSAIQEFQVNTSNYSAEYGRAAGGVVNAVTKSGTNQLHGDAFYYQRNNSWGARNPRAFLNGVGYKPEDVRHQFGGTLGGPIVKDKLFFFFSYDQQKRNFPGLAIFDNSAYLNTSNNTILASRGLSLAQIDSAKTFLTSLTGPVERTGDQTLILPKIDWQISSKHNLSANYNRLRWASPAGIQTQATNTRGTNSFGDDFVKVDWGTVRLQSTLRPTLLNEVRFQYARDFEYQKSQPTAAGEPSTGLNGSSPQVILTNGLTFGKPDFLERPGYPIEKRTQITDNVTWLKDKYTIKFGFDFNHVDDTLDNLRFESGGYTYSNINDFIIDYVNWKQGLPASTVCATSSRTRGKCYTSRYNQGFGTSAFQLSTNDYNAYVNLDWKLASRLTLNLGLRYEYEALPSAINPSTSTAVIPYTDGLTVAKATSTMASDTNNFGPRVGFAIDVTGDGRTSLRGGYGMYFGRIINSTIYNALVNTNMLGGQFQLQLDQVASNAPIFPNVLASVGAVSGAVQYFAPNFENPTIHQGDLIFERQIARKTTVSASYLMSAGRKLVTFVDKNLGFPLTDKTYTVTGGAFGGQSVTVKTFPTGRPLTASGFSQSITEIQSSITSLYNALVIQGNQRLSRGLQFQASYTLAKATDGNQRSSNFTENNVPFNIYDMGADYGISNFDIRHKISINAVYQPSFKANSRFTNLLLNDWTISPIYQYFSGKPYDGFVSGTSSSLNGSGGNNRFPLLERNAYRQSSLWNVDLRLSRRITLKENRSIEVLGEAFNLFNRTQVTGVNTTFYRLSGSNLQYEPTFGSTTDAGGTLFRERQIQIAVRFKF